VAQVDALVELLGYLHRLGARKTEAICGGLLQLGCRKRRLWFDGAVYILNIAHHGELSGQGRNDLLRVRLVFDRRFFSAKEGELGADGMLVGAQVRLDRPILFWNERFDFPFSIADELERHGLHPSCGEPRLHLLPKQGGKGVADKPVDDAPRFLRLDEAHVDVPRVVHRLLHRRLCDFIEGHPVYGRLLYLFFEVFAYLVRDGLSLAVGVRREHDGARAFGLFGELSELFGLAAHRDILRLEVVLDVDRHARFGEVDHLAVGGEHPEMSAEILLYCPCLGGRLDDDEGLGFGNAAGRRRIRGLFFFFLRCCCHSILLRLRLAYRVGCKGPIPDACSVEQRGDLGAAVDGACAFPCERVRTGVS
jgi:hypothetical protein